MYIANFILYIPWILDRVHLFIVAEVTVNQFQTLLKYIEETPPETSVSISLSTSRLISEDLIRQHR